jgi:hypothetical protein
VVRPKVLENPYGSGPGLCSISDMNVGEYLFHALLG